MEMKILIAVDGSPISDAAVIEIARRPWPPGTEVKIISVAEWPAGPGIRESLAPTMLEDVEQTARDHATGIADRAMATFREHEAQVTPISQCVVVDTAKDAIIEEAEHWGADLIVVGSHGYRGYKRFLLGSVSQAVAAHAKCSVEIVRHPVATE
jgi:nucleotide-binding universal stress UspA family protein